MKWLLLLIPFAILWVGCYIGFHYMSPDDWYYFPAIYTFAVLIAGTGLFAAYKIIEG